MKPCFVPSFTNANKLELSSALRVLGGIHGTFMYRQVLSEAPWIDVIVRGEGEEIMVALAEAVRDGRWPADQRKIKGLAFAVELDRGNRAAARQPFDGFHAHRLALTLDERGADAGAQGLLEHDDLN